MSNGTENRHLASWKLAPLADIAKIEWGNTSITKKSYIKEGYLAYSAKGPDGFLPEAQWFGPGVVVSAIGAQCGKCFYASGEWCAIKNTIVIQSTVDEISNKFLFYRLNGQRNWKLSGSGQPFITLNTARKKLILLPPLGEQRRIVAKIEALFSELEKGIESLMTAREQLKVYRQAVLKHAFEGKLTAQWREENKDKLESPKQLLARIQQEREARYRQQSLDWQTAIKEWEKIGEKGKKPGKPKSLVELKAVSETTVADFPKLPSGWAYVRLGSIIDEPTYGTSKKCAYESGEKGVLRIPNISSGRVDATDLKFASFDDDEINALSLETGDLLTIRSNGSVSLVGSCALITQRDTEFLFAGYLIRLRPHQETVIPSFLLLVLSSHLLRRQIESAAKSTSGVNNINTSEIQNLIIPLPSIEEQLQILKVTDVNTPNIKSTENEIDIQGGFG